VKILVETHHMVLTN